MLGTKNINGVNGVNGVNVANGNLWCKAQFCIVVMEMC